MADELADYALRRDRCTQFQPDDGLSSSSAEPITRWANRLRSKPDALADVCLVMQRALSPQARGRA